MSNKHQSRGSAGLPPDTEMLEPEDPDSPADIGLGAPIGHAPPMQEAVNPAGPMTAESLGEPSTAPVAQALTRARFMEKYGKQIPPNGFIPRAFQTPLERKAMAEKARRMAERPVGNLTK